MTFRSLTGLARVLLLTLIAGSAPLDAAQAKWAERTAAFLQTQERDDGGYAFPDQAQSHLTTTYAALDTQRLLGLSPPHGQRVADFVRTAHPQLWRKPAARQHQFELQQIEALQWLGNDPAGQFAEDARTWTKPKPYNPTFELHAYPSFQQQMACLVARKRLGVPNDDLPDFVAYIEARRRENGSYNNNPPGDDRSDGQVLNTYWALQGLEAIGRPVGKPGDLIAWLQACQRPDGHFAWSPRPPLAANSDDVIYTWAAVRSLKWLGAKPKDSSACVTFLHRLFNADGGFGDRPGWPSNALATYYAVDALSALDALADDIGLPQPPAEPPSLPAGLKIFTAQIEAPGVGSPAEAVDMARAMRVDLWGAKGAVPAWLERAQAIADRDRVPVTFFVANEEYNTYFDIPGMGTYSHLVDIMAPRGVDFGKSMAGVRPPPSYRRFLDERLAPLLAAGGGNVYQFNENESLERMLLDASLEEPGFVAISTFHFNNPDFSASSPYLWHYQHRIPLVSLQDNHAQQPWHWGDQLAGYRTLFLAERPTFAGWMDALKHNRVVAVRNDEVTGHRLWIHGGDPATRARVEADRKQWQWWQDKPTDAAPTTGRPMVSMVVVRANDPFELATPNKGLALRIRRRWSNTAGGMLDRPTAELVSVTIDGRAVEPQCKVVEKVAKTTTAESVRPDEYFVVSLSDLPPGRHTATATVKPLEGAAVTNATSQTVEFTTP